MRALLALTILFQVIGSAANASQSQMGTCSYIFGSLIHSESIADFFSVKLNREARLAIVDSATPIIRLRLLFTLVQKGKWQAARRQKDRLMETLQWIDHIISHIPPTDTAISRMIYRRVVFFLIEMSTPEPPQRRAEFYREQYYRQFPREFSGVWQMLLAKYPSGKSMPDWDVRAAALQIIVHLLNRGHLGGSADAAAALTEFLMLIMPQPLDVYPGGNEILESLVASIKNFNSPEIARLFHPQFLQLKDMFKMYVIKMADSKRFSSTVHSLWMETSKALAMPSG